LKKPLLLAHRGFSCVYPENSPLAFRMAAEKTRADGFESDVRYSKDGALVIFHDPVLDRTSNGSGPVSALTLDELRAVDIGAWKSPEFAGQHMWTLGELLDFCREAKLVLNLELKNCDEPCPDLEARVIGEITRRGMQDRVFVSSFNHVSMHRFRELCPDIGAGFLYSYPLFNIGGYLAGAGVTAVHPLWKLLVLQPGLMDVFRRLGLKVNVWTVDGEAEMRNMTAAGADGIISNRPDLLCSAVEKALQGSSPSGSSSLAP
jgi:glycerophosphoryl diester phosphodiesterase